jgi:rSAM/selenodomain-associated transferase 1
MNQKLIVFARAPGSGQVKTRLAKGIGEQAAAHAYKTIVDRLLANLKAVLNVELRCTPDSAGAEFDRWLQPGWRLAPQGEGDLGQRLIRAFAESFTAGSRRVVIVGSDCPAVTAQDIESAWHSLVTHDVVLGPARDGGYWLIGLREPQPALFENIPWSTPAALETTLSRIRKAGLTVQCLRTLADIDTAEDWEELNRA